MKEARYYKSLEDGKVQCFLCPHECVIADGRRGICTVRENQQGVLYSLVYEQVAAVALDPIEKKPLYHFFPGTSILSLGTLGCNLSCPWCQNWHLVNHEVPARTLTAEEAVRQAVESSSIGIAYTYNEPFIWFEYVLDTAVLARSRGLRNVLVTNCMVNEEPLKELLPHVDAMNIDLKFIRPEPYKRYCRGALEQIKANIRTVSSVCHVEITNLIIPGINDSSEEIEDWVEFVVSVGKDIPVHFSRYFPAYNMDNPETPVSKLLEAYELAREKLNFVYLGNVGIEGTSDTFCPKCGELLISREGYLIRETALEGNRCSKCQQDVAVITK